MRYMRGSVAVLVACLLAGSCQITSWSWVTPPQVAVGTTFVVEVNGAVNVVAGSLAAVLQLPTAFQHFDAHVHTSNGTTATITGHDSPAVLSSYAAEPGYFLTSFEGTSGFTEHPFNVALKVYLRAPAMPGVYTLKIALGGIPSSTGTYQTQFPVGVTNFALINAAVHVHTILVVNTPAPPPFTLAADGLWSWPGGASWLRPKMADFDGDGRDDLVVANSSTASPQVWLSRPSGWIAAGNGLPLVGGGGAIAVGDFDGDGYKDLVASTGRVLFGGAGVTWIQGPLLPHALSLNPYLIAVATGDVNADGRVDVVLSDGTGYYVFRANADRTFTSFGNGLPGPAASSGGWLVVVDLEQDGISEILGPGQMWRSDGQGNWQTVAGLPPSTVAAVVLDIDRDGVMEVVVNGAGVAFTYVGQALQPGTLTVPLVFDDAVAMDYDRDGWTDIVLSKNGPFYIAYSSVFQLWRNQGGVGFSQVPLTHADGFGSLHPMAGGWPMGRMAVGDIDGDSFPDLAAIPGGEGPRVWRNSSTGASAYGSPCSASGFPTPQLRALGTVAPGQSPALELLGASSMGFTIVWVGTSKRHWLGAPLLPLALGQFGAPGCSVLAEPAQASCYYADVAGRVTVAVALPNLAAMQQLTFFAQGAVLAPGANGLDLLFSNGLALKLQ